MKKSILTLCLLLFFACSKKNKKESFLLEEVSPKKSGVNFINKIKDDVQHNIIRYIYFYNGGGLSVGDINNDNLPDIYFVSNKGNNKLYLNKGNLTFEDITTKANVSGYASWQTGSTMIDINNDGYLDIYVCAVTNQLGFKGHNELYINNGDNTFTEKSKEYGLDFKGFSTQAYFFDYDKDNDLDVYIVNQAVHTKTSHGPALIRKKRTALTGDVLLKNNNNKFQNASEEAKVFGGVNGYGLSASIADFNNDGWDDIYVCNDFHEDDYYYINNQDGTFSEKLSESFSMISRFSMGSDAADINNNGYQDLITLDMLPKDERALKESEGDDSMLNVHLRLKKLGYQDQYARNMLQINNDENIFSEEAIYNGIEATDWSWAPLFADFNNDGYNDLFVANGILRRPNDLDFRMYIASTFKKSYKSKNQWLVESLSEMPSGKVPNEIFKGNSDSFTNMNNKWIKNKPSLSNGAVYVDLDLDGDLDIVTNNLNEPATIYKNNTNSNNKFISITPKFIGNNINGIGTKIKLYQQNITQTKQLFNSRGFMSSVENKLHFGLDSINKIDSIQVIWPNNKTQTLKNVKTNQQLTLKYDTDNCTNWNQKNKNKNTLLKKENLINFTHKEDEYNDFYYERLIPYKVSTSGPAIAKADIDGNGFEDLFIGNSSGKKAVFFFNNGKKLIQKEFTQISKDSLFEDTCATFFDADNDGDLDLYVGSGINNKRNKTYELDRLYINTGKDFVKETSIIKNHNITSCVIAFDADEDGDNDLFIGNRSNPDSFGEKQPSHLLLNDGKGNFIIDKTFDLKAFVTNAVLEDIDNNGKKDLLISTEWDTPKIYLNQNSKLNLINSEIAKNGLWQTIKPFDIDNDGDKDILLGNWGTNTKYKANSKKPLLMYYSDFDNNGKKETVVAYNSNNKYYPIYSKDELASQINIIKKRFVKYKDYALKTIDQVLTKKALDKAIKLDINNTQSGYLENNNGNFDKFIPFPKDFQIAPINSFSELHINNEKNILVFGNNTSVNTYHGGYESLKGLLLKNNNSYFPTSSLGIEAINSQVKDAKRIKLKNKEILVIISNNDNVKTYTIDENPKK